MAKMRGDADSLGTGRLRPAPDKLTYNTEGSHRQPTRSKGFSFKPGKNVSTKRGPRDRALSKKSRSSY